MLYLNLNNITIIGASLGGMLAPRAAAFNKEIKRVIAWSVFTDFSEIILDNCPQRLVKIIKFMMKIKAYFIINSLFNFLIKHGKNEKVKWGILHGMYAYDAKTPCGYIRKLKKFQTLDIGKLIYQDVLILSANKDNFINYHRINDEIDEFTNAKSFTFRLLTNKQSAGVQL